MRHRSEAERRRIVEDWKESGESAKGYGLKVGISAETLKRWRRGFIKEPDIGEAAIVTSSAGKETFLPVTVIPTKPRSRDETCSVIVRDSIRIVIGPDSDEAVVALAIRAAVAACGQTSVR